MGGAMEKRVTELEIRFMQQEHTIQELNDTVYRHEQLIIQLQQQVTLLTQQMRSMAPSDNRTPDEEERPPHY